MPVVMRVMIPVALAATGVFWAVRGIWAYAGILWVLSAAGGLANRRRPYMHAGTRTGKDED
jgi:hypothetical protein